MIVVDVVRLMPLTLHSMGEDFCLLCECVLYLATLFTVPSTFIAKLSCIVPSTFVSNLNPYEI
jgi:hypothetical protein